MESPLKVSVFGAGVFAGYHAQKVKAHPRAALKGIYDPDLDRATALARKLDTKVFPTAESAIEACDAAICAVPAIYHKTVAIPVLTAGRSILIEKPLAETPEEGRAILAAAQYGGGKVQVGHQERLVTKAIGLDQIKERPVQIDITRQSGQTIRNLDTSVVKDLMIHDLDLLLHLFGPIDWVATEQAKMIYSDHLDSVRAEIGFDDFTAYVSASRDAEPERRWRLRYESGTVDIDFGAKTLRHDTPFALNADFGDLPSVKDSLGTAFDRFVKACLDNAEPLVSGEAGLAALDLAQKIEEDGSK